MRSPEGEHRFFRFSRERNRGCIRSEYYLACVGGRIPRNWQT